MPTSSMIEKLKKASGTVNSFIRTGDGDEVVVPLDIVITFLGDAAYRKDVGYIGATDTATTGFVELAILRGVYGIIEEHCPHVLTEDARGIALQQYADKYKTDVEGEEGK